MSTVCKPFRDWVFSQLQHLLIVFKVCISKPVKLSELNGFSCWLITQKRLFLTPTPAVLSSPTLRRLLLCNYQSLNFLTVQIHNEVIVSSKMYLAREQQTQIPQCTMRFSCYTNGRLSCSQIVYYTITITLVRLSKTVSILLSNPREKKRKTSCIHHFIQYTNDTEFEACIWRFHSFHMSLKVPTWRLSSGIILQNKLIWHHKQCGHTRNQLM